MTDDLKKLAEAVNKVAPGPWEADSEKMTDAPLQHHEYVLLDAKGNRLLDTTNSDPGFGLIEEEHDEDGYRAWNEPARVLIEYLRAAEPNKILALYAERDEALNALASGVYEQALSGDPGSSVYVHTVALCVERMRDAEAVLAKRDEEVAGLKEQSAILGMIDTLRAPEGATVTLCCDNPDFNGLPNCLVIVVDDWTEWDEREFRADSVSECLRAALAAAEAGEPVAAHPLNTSPVVSHETGNVRDKPVAAGISDVATLMALGSRQPAHDPILGEIADIAERLRETHPMEASRILILLGKAGVRLPAKIWEVRGQHPDGRPGRNWVAVTSEKAVLVPDARKRRIATE